VTAETAVLLQNGPNFLVFVDKDGKEIAGRKTVAGEPYGQADMEPVGPDRLLGRGLALARWGHQAGDGIRRRRRPAPGPVRAGR
jgi:hypothetical protein